MITLDKCPICEGQNINKFQEIITILKNSFGEVIPNVKVEVAPIDIFYKCSDCKIIFQNPRFSDDEVKTYYAKGYYSKTVNATDEQIDSDEKGRAKYDGDLIRKHVSNIHSHLDVGGGRGYLLTEIGAFQKVLVEPNNKHAKIAGIEYQKELDTKIKQEFDLVTAIHVLEHEPYPHIYLQKMARMVKKEGFFVVEVPSWNSPGGPLRLPHLYHFEPDVLRWLCNKAGLKVVKTLFTPHLLLICRKKSDK